MANLTNINNKFLVTTGGNVGINTTSPSQKVEITGGYLKFSGGDYGIQGSASLTYNPVSDHYFQASGSTKVTFKADGKVGIGTTAPNHKVDIYSNENVPLRIHRPSNANLNSSGAWGIGFSTRGDAITSTTDTRAGIFSYYNGNLFFATNNSSIVADPDASARMTILNNGNVGIGTSSPSYKLDVQVSGNVARFGDGTRFFRVYTDADEVSLLADGSVPMKFYTSGTERMRIDSNGKVGIGTTSPDITGFGWNVLTVVGGTTAGSAGVLELGAPSTDANDQNYGIIAFMGGTGRNAQIAANRDSATNDGRLSFWTSPGAGGIVERMRIDSSGNVGIGTAGMNTTLNLYSSSNTQIGFQDASTGTGSADGFRVGYNGTYGQMWLFENAAMRFATNNTERMRITSDGNVGIGTTSPAAKLQSVQTTSGEWTGGFKNYTSNGYGLRVDMSGSSSVQAALQVYTGSGTGFVVKNSGVVGIGTFTPGAKLEISGIRENQIRLTSYDTTAAVDEIIGGVEFYSSDTGNEGVKASISAIAANTEGSAYMTFSTGTNTERMRIDSSGRVEVKSRVLSIDAVDEYRENFTTTGNATPSFDIDVKSIGASGQPFEVFVAWTHYSTSYGAGLHQAYYQRSTVQSNITLIHTYFNQTSTLGGAWSVSYVNATTIRVSKSAGTHAGAGYGYIRVTRLKP